MGSYVRSFFVGRREFELYAESDEDGVVGYELISVRSGRKLNDGLLAEEPADADVEALVQERGATAVIDLD